MRAAVQAGGNSRSGKSRSEKRRLFRQRTDLSSKPARDSDLAMRLAAREVDCGLNFSPYFLYFPVLHPSVDPDDDKGWIAKRRSG